MYPYWYHSKLSGTSVVYGMKITLEPGRRSHCSDPAFLINEYVNSIRRFRAEDIANKAAIFHIVTSGTDTNDVIGRGDVATSIQAQGSVTTARRVESERATADGCIAGAGGVGK